MSQSSNRAGCFRYRHCLLAGRRSRRGKANLEGVARARGLSDERIGTVTRQKAAYSEIV
jgi:hypothetical protein